MPAWCGDGDSGLPKRHAYTYAARLLRRGKGARQNRAAGGRWHLESTRNCRYSARPGSHLFTGFSAGCWPSLGDWSRVCSFIAAPGRTTGTLEGALRGAVGGGMQSVGRWGRSTTGRQVCGARYSSCRQSRALPGECPRARALATHFASRSEQKTFAPSPPQWAQQAATRTQQRARRGQADASAPAAASESWRWPRPRKAFWHRRSAC